MKKDAKRTWKAGQETLHSSKDRWEESQNCENEDHRYTAAISEIVCCFSISLYICTSTIECRNF